MTETYQIPWESITTQALLWLVTGLLGWLAGRVTAYGKAQRAEDAALRDGVRALLRSELMHTHHGAVSQGWCSTTDKEIMQRTYDAYHALGGNDVATNLYREMMALPTRDG